MTEQEEAQKSSDAYEHMEEGHLDEGLKVIGEFLAEKEGKKKLQSSTGPTKAEMSTDDSKMKEEQEKLKAKFGKNREWRL